MILLCRTDGLEDEQDENLWPRPFRFVNVDTGNTNRLFIVAISN